ncbi:MAG: hypothetical protein ABL995_08805 [Bryobacteraceae bacterium]
MSQVEELNLLDELIAGVSRNDRGAQSEGPSGLMLEHLRAARSSLLGAMRVEYNFSLESAIATLSSVPEKVARLKVKHVLQRLIDLQAEKPVPLGSA